LRKSSLRRTGSGKVSRKPVARQPEPPSTRISIRVPDDELAEWQRLADKHGISLARFIKLCVRDAKVRFIASRSMPTISGKNDRRP
jgi:hypothetical protein